MASRTGPIHTSICKCMVAAALSLGISACGDEDTDDTAAERIETTEERAENRAEEETAAGTETRRTAEDAREQADRVAEEIEADLDRAAEQAQARADETRERLQRELEQAADRREEEQPGFIGRIRDGTVNVFRNVGETVGLVADREERQQEQQRRQISANLRSQLPIFDPQYSVLETTEKYADLLAATDSEEIEDIADDLAEDIVGPMGPDLANRIFQIREVNSQIDEVGVNVPDLERKIMLLDQEIGDEIQEFNESQRTKQLATLAGLETLFIVLIGVLPSPTAVRMAVTKATDDIERIGRRGATATPGEQNYRRQWQAAFDDGVRNNNWQRATELREAGSPVPRLGSDYLDQLRRRAGPERATTLDNLLAHTETAPRGWQLAGTADAMAALRAGNQESVPFFNDLVAKLANIREVRNVGYVPLDSATDAVRWVRQGGQRWRGLQDWAGPAAYSDNLPFRRTTYQGVETYVAGATRDHRTVLRITPEGREPIYVGVAALERSDIGDMRVIAGRIDTQADNAVGIFTTDGYVNTGLRLEQLSDRTVRVGQVVAGGLAGWSVAKGLDALGLYPADPIDNPDQIYIENRIPPEPERD